MFKVCRHRNAEAFLRRAEAWLVQAEAEHNLLLGIARKLATSTEDAGEPAYLATIEHDGVIAGCAFRTPPHKLGLTRMPLEAIPVLIEDLVLRYDRLPAVLGPEEETPTFAALWSKAKNVEATPGMRQRIYQLDAVIPPPRMPSGHLRVARMEDLDLVTRWIMAFSADAGIPSVHPRQMAHDWITQQAMHLWEDGAPVSMAGWTGRTPHGARVGYVYTPPSMRGRGYASACVAVLSQLLLDAGLQCCFLYTDLSNPTSNSIYQRIGYYPVCDVMDYHFGKRHL